MTEVVTAFASTPAVSVYDIMNEPSDGTTTNVTAWTTYCSHHVRVDQGDSR